MKNIIAACFLSLCTLTAFGQNDTDTKAVNDVLDNIYKMASEANFEGYFGLYTKDAIFLGTDATERWTMDEFKGYAKASFDRGRGWTYIPT